jgi:hypothetical protein
VTRREFMSLIGGAAAYAASPIQAIEEGEVRAAAQVLGMKMLSLGVRTQEEIEDALAAIVRERPGALLVLGIACSCITARTSWTSPPNTACRECMRTVNWSRRAG